MKNRSITNKKVNKLFHDAMRKLNNNNFILFLAQVYALMQLQMNESDVKKIEKNLDVLLIQQDIMQNRRGT